MSQQVKVITLNGILNAITSEEFQKDIAKILENDAKDAKIVLVDCQNVTFIDSSGLGALVLAFKKLKEVGATMALCSINEQVRILFELTGMDKVFEIFPNQDAFHQVVL